MSTKEWIKVDNGIYIQKLNDGKGISLNDHRNGAVIKCSFKLFMFLDDDGEKDLDRRRGKWISLEERTLESFQLGENDMVKGLEIIFLKGNFRIGDKFRARIDSSLAYGDKGRPAIQLSNLIQPIPPNTDLEYMIEIADISYFYPYPHNFAVDQNTSKLIITKAIVSTDIDFNTISESGVVAYCNLRKESGNRWFKFQNFDLAANAYGRGAIIADAYMKLGTDFDKKKMTELYIACLNNLAACHISRGNMIRAKAETRKVLEIDPNNVKALLRTARASLAIQDWEDCQNCLETIMNSQKPNDEWYQFALIEMRRLEKAKLKFCTDVLTPEAKVKNAVMSVLRSSSPKTPIEIISTEVSAKMKLRTRSYLAFYVKWISFVMILICFILILYILFNNKKGLTINGVLDFVKDFVKFVQAIKLEDVKRSIKTTALRIKSINVNDTKEKILEISRDIHVTLKNSNWFASVLNAYNNISSNLSASQIKTYLEDMKFFDMNSLMEKISSGFKLLQKEGINTLSTITRQNVDESATIVDHLPPSTFKSPRFGQSKHFGTKITGDVPVVALGTSILLAAVKNLRF